MSSKNINVIFAENVSQQIKPLRTTQIFILVKNPTSASFVRLGLLALEIMQHIFEVILVQTVEMVQRSCLLHDEIHFCMQDKLRNMFGIISDLVLQGFLIQLHTRHRIWKLSICITSLAITATRNMHQKILSRYQKKLFLEMSLSLCIKLFCQHSCCLVPSL